MVFGGPEHAWGHSTNSRPSQTPRFAAGPRGIGVWQTDRSRPCSARPAEASTYCAALPQLSEGMPVEEIPSAAWEDTDFAPVVDPRWRVPDIEVRRCDGSALRAAWSLGGTPRPRVETFEVEVLGYDLRGVALGNCAAIPGDEGVSPGPPAAPLRRIRIVHVAGSRREANVVGLRQHRIYKVRVRALDPEGPWSASVTARTEAGGAATRPSHFWHKYNQMQNQLVF